MIEEERSGGWAERRRWLHPEEERRLERCAGRVWPDMGPAGRDARRRLLLAESAPRSGAGDKAGLADAREAERQRLLARALAELGSPPSPGAVLAVLETGLDPACEPELLRARLAALDELLAPLEGEEAPGAPGEGAECALRLRERLRHLEHRLPGSELAAAAPRLAALAEDWRRRPAAAGADPARDWEWRTGEALRPEPLLALFNEQIRRTAAELGKRCAVLRARYLGERPEDDGAAAFVARQLAEDRCGPERWEKAHADELGRLAAWIGRRGLLPGEVEFRGARVLPGAAPAWPAVDAGERAGPAGGATPLADLTRLPLPDREDWLRDRHTAALPLWLAREALPGRRWLLERLLAVDPLRGRLLKPEDLDGWAGWAPEALFAAGWQSGEPRARIVHLRDRLRELALGRADLQRLLELRPEDEIRRLLAREGGFEGAPLAAAWRALFERPGRWAAGALRRHELSAARRRWRRRHGSAAGPGDAVDLFALACTLPLPWIRERLAEVPPAGRSLRDLPPAIPPPRAGDREELVREVEERLAALGRIRREDLDAGREFDGQPAPPPAEPPDDAPEAGEPQAEVRTGAPFGAPPPAREAAPGEERPSDA